MRARLAAGDNLILFPEGTSSDGSRVLPFRSAFFSVVETATAPGAPLIQPVSVVYDRLGGLPMGRASRPVFAWYGDMELGSHFWRLAQLPRAARDRAAAPAGRPGRLPVPQGAGAGGVGQRWRTARPRCGRTARCRRPRSRQRPTVGVAKQAFA